MLQPVVEGLLHILRELTRLVDLVFERNALHHRAQLMYALVAHRVFARRHVQRVRLRGEVQVVGFYAARRGVGRAVRVHADEEVRLRLVRNGRARFQWNECIVRARVDDLRAQVVMQELAQAERHVQHHVLLHNAARPQRARVMAAVARVDHDAADLQSQRAHQRPFALGGGCGCPLRRNIGRCVHGCAARAVTRGTFALARGCIVRQGLWI